MERTWIRESSFNIEKGGMKMLRAKICVCMCSEGLEKSVRSRGRTYNLDIELRA